MEQLQYLPNTTEKAENLQLPQATDANAGHPYKADTSGSFQPQYDLNLSRVRCCNDEVSRSW